MSWDTITKPEQACPCGKGTYVTIMEMDDWNRCRSFTTIKCRACARKNTEAHKLIAKHETKERSLKRAAESVAKKLYLPEFLAGVSGGSKKEVWTKVFRGRRYPSLSTFYAHTKAPGAQERYLERHFLENLNEFFPKRFKDARIEKLLRQAVVAKASANKVQRDYAVFLPVDD